MYQVLSAGGWVMPVIMLCSIVALAMFIERQFALNRKKIAPPCLLATVWQQRRGEALDAQRMKNLWQGSPAGAILVAGLVNRHQVREDMRGSIQEAASHVIHQLGHFTIATVPICDD